MVKVKVIAEEEKEEEVSDKKKLEEVVEEMVEKYDLLSPRPDDVVITVTDQRGRKYTKADGSKTLAKLGIKELVIEKSIIF